MYEVMSLIKKIIDENTLIGGVLSGVKSKELDFSKVDIKPVEIKDQLLYQFTYDKKPKVIHQNRTPAEAKEEIENLLKDSFKQGMFFSIEGDYQVFISKKGKASVLKKKPSKELIVTTHNRKKNYILEDKEPIDFLIRLGVMNENGKVVAKRYDKFRQINRFLEMVADVIPRIDKDKTLNIVDFGCGKSYLTFALYHYLVNVLKLNINIIGLDLKMDVILFCNEVAMDLGFDRLKFIHGDIKDYEGLKDVDMVVTLHACDNATDAALIKAINWNAQAILSVPCCQHELYSKIKNPVLEPMLKHGIITEKLSSLVTDSLRANVLEILGYQVQLLEFIDMEHTPKNILIRAIKTKHSFNKEALDSYKEFKRFWGLNELYIERELGDRLKGEKNA